jgi:nucleotide-binding universal stress UspA family protein
MSGSTQAPLLPALKNILYATDFSPCSQAALPYLRTIAARSGAIVHVLHVLAPEARTSVPMDEFSELDVEWNLAQSAMKTLLAAPSFAGIAHTATIERGPLWDVLASYIEKQKIDLVVLGTHGRRGLKKLVLGSVAEQVFRHASSPVLTVGPQAVGAQMAQASVATILFATDFSSGSLHALPYALSLARANNSHLILLHAVPLAMEMLPAGMDAVPVSIEVSAELTENSLAAARQQMAELLSPETRREVNPEIVVESGPAAETILAIAKSKQADLIVMGVHHASKASIASHLPWTTASEVVCQAHCPVLTVRS